MKVKQGTLDWQIANNFMISERDHEDQSLGGGRGGLISGAEPGIKCRLAGSQANGGGTWPNVVVVVGAGESRKDSSLPEFGGAIVSPEPHLV